MYDARDYEAFEKASLNGSPKALREYLDKFPEGKYVQVAGRRIDIMKDQDALQKLALLVLSARVRPRLPRADVRVVLIDDGQHAEHVKEAVASQYDGLVSVLPMSEPLVRNLEKVLEWKAQQPGVLSASVSSASPTSSSSSIASSREAALTAEKSPFCQRQMDSGACFWSAIPASIRASKRAAPSSNCRKPECVLPDLMRSFASGTRL